jgi:hypothetical protein
MKSLSKQEFITKNQDVMEESLTYNLGHLSPPPPRYCRDENGNIYICDE